MNRRTFTSLIVAVAAAGLLLAAPLLRAEEKKERKTYHEPPKMTIDKDKTYVATIDTDKGKIVCELFPKEAPETVNSFVFLAHEGFYDGLTFHRVEDWVIQGGDPSGNGTGGPGYHLRNEAGNNVHSHSDAGTLAMARSREPDSAGSQFYITKQAAPWLDKKYTIFGQVTKGMDVVNQIAIGDKIKTITIEEKK